MSLKYEPSLDTRAAPLGWVHCLPTAATRAIFLLEAGFMRCVRIRGMRCLQLGKLRIAMTGHCLLPGHAVSAVWHALMAWGHHMGLAAFSEGSH
jgi:hypothetical protein